MMMMMTMLMAINFPLQCGAGLSSENEATLSGASGLVDICCQCSRYKQLGVSKIVVSASVTSASCDHDVLGKIKRDSVVNLF